MTKTPNKTSSARSAVGVGLMRWDTTLATYARNYPFRQINNCANFMHSGEPYKENLAADGVQAVQLWVDEKKDYNYKSNSCVNGDICGHYTLVVRRKLFRLGCVRVQCNNGWRYIICSYAPPGNVVSQHPY